MRSRKWISTSVTDDKLNTDLAKYSSADYHVNNMVSPVLFHSALQKLPENAIAIEVIILNDFPDSFYFFRVTLLKEV